MQSAGSVLPPLRADHQPVRCVVAWCAQAENQEGVIGSCTEKPVRPSRSWVRARLVTGPVRS